MKTIDKFLASVLMAMATVIASCSNDDDPAVPSQQEIETKIAGKWKVMSVNGSECLTNDRKVTTFMKDGTGTFSMSETRSAESGHVWENQEPFSYKVSNNELLLTMDSGKRSMYYTITDITDGSLTSLLFKNVIANGPTLSPDEKCVGKKVVADYSKDIIGLWEGVEMTGDETFGNAEARIAYHADGTYTYYKKYAEVWCPSEDESCEYNVDGDWLATRWRKAKDADYDYEWWDIEEIKDGKMKWSALRERNDGSRYTTTFTWKKVEIIADDQLNAMLLGTWEAYKTKHYSSKNGEVVEDFEEMNEGKQRTTYRDDNTFTYSYVQEDGSFKEFSIHRYWIKGNVIYSTFIDVPIIVNDNSVGQSFVTQIDEETMTIAIYGEFNEDGVEQYLVLATYIRK